VLVTGNPTCANKGGNEDSQAHFAWANFVACWQQRWLGKGGLAFFAVVKISCTWESVIGVSVFKG
jgi:hypothetical protein